MTPSAATRLAEFHLAQLGDHKDGLCLRRLEIFLGVDGLQHRRDLAHLRRRYRRPNIAVKMDRAALPGRLWIKLHEALHQAQALVADEQANTVETAFLQVAQKGDP